MKLEEFLLNHYLKIEFEQFSHKSVRALGILRVMLSNPMNKNAGTKKIIAEKIEKIEWIIENTHENIMVHLFILDRNILPQDSLKDVHQNTSRFNNHNDKTVDLSQDALQKYLSLAMMEIDGILMECISSYSEQMSFDTW